MVLIPCSTAALVLSLTFGKSHHLFPLTLVLCGGNGFADPKSRVFAAFWDSPSPPAKTATFGRI
jgi:hypothetical protein